MTVARDVSEADGGVGIAAEGGGIDEALVFGCARLCWPLGRRAPVQPWRT